MSAKKMRPLVIGIAGGSGSGKSSISNAVLKRLLNVDRSLLPKSLCSQDDQLEFNPASLVSLIAHDSYYKSWPGVDMEELEKKNFDHPDALDTDLLVEHLKTLKNGGKVGVPVYDFKTHSRKDEVTTIEPTPIIFLDGILIFCDPELRKLIDIKIFVDTDPDIRFIRRLKRDTTERGRTAEYVSEQYLGTVRPMHLQFVEPSKRYADIVIPEGGYDSHIAMDMVVGHIIHELNKNCV